MPERPIELRPARRLSVLLTTHSKAASQPVSSLIHWAEFPATRTGTQNASLHILIGSISQFARFGLHFPSTGRRRWRIALLGCSRALRWDTFHCPVGQSFSS